MRYKLPSPLLGWNTQDSLSEMQEGYALTLDNYFPSETRLAMRKGYTELYDTGETTAVKTLMSYEENDSLLSATNGKIFNGETEIGDEFSNDIWIHTYYKNRLYMCNGADNAQVYYYNTGSSLYVLEDISFTGSTVKTFAWCSQANNELLFGMDDSLDFYYGGIGNVSGTLTKFFLSQYVRKGGKLINATTWGNDSGDGFKKYTAFITSEGEVIVYSGSGFGTLNISLQGNFYTGRPLGRNCFLNWGADIVIITEKGYVSLNNLIANGEIMKKSELFSSKIDGAVIDLASSYSSYDGWKAQVHGKENFVLFNAPTEDSFEQHIMNLSTGAWCRFVGIKAYDWASLGGSLMFGGDDGKIYQYIGNSDNGGNINGEIKSVYTKLGTEQAKLFKIFKTKMEADADVDVSYSLGIDYVDAQYSFIPSEEPGGFYWDTDPAASTNTEYWNEGTWSGGIEDVSRWRSIGGYGTTCSLQIKTSVSGVNIYIYETLFEYEVSGGSL